MIEYFVNLSLIAIGFLGVLVIFLLLFSYKSNTLVNIYLVIIFTISSFRFIHKGIYELYHPNLFETTFNWLSPFFLLAVPCFYLYYKSLVNDNRQYNYKDLLHFTYPIFNVLYIVLQKKYVLFTQDSSHLIQIGALTFFILFYLILSFQLLNRKLWNNKNSELIVNKHYLLIKNWTQFFYFIFLLLAFRLLFSVYLGSNSTFNSPGFSYVLFAVVLWLIIYIKILIHPEILYGYPKLEEKLAIQNKTILNLGVWELASPEVTNLQDQKLTIGIETKMTPYIQEMEDFINTNHPFRDPNFSIKDLSITLNIPTSHLVYIFKYHCNKPYVEYKKYCKIEDAKILIKDNYLEKNTLESLSNEIGFISYNTFYSSFKKYNNVSPKAYLDSISRA